MKKVLVTGAYGFLGRHVARVFSEKKWHVLGIGHGNWAEMEWKSWGLSEWHGTDINFNALMTYVGESEIIIHCAGSADVSFSMKHPRQDFERSVNTTLDVLEYARLQSPATAVVFPSSAAVYGKTLSLPTKEDQSLIPISPYGVHKMIGEQLINSYARHYLVPASIVRFFSLYGAGLRKQIFWDACNRLVRGENSFFGTGHETRDFLHVHDAARLMYTAAMNVDTACSVVNGGTGVQTTIEDLLAEIVRNLPGTDTPVFSGAIRTGDPEHYLADVSIARKWGWETQYELRDGIVEYVKWFRKGAAEIA